MGLVKLGEFYDVASDNFIHRYAYTAGVVIYHGWAKPGTADSAIGWCIVKYTYDGSDLIGIDHPKNDASTPVQTNEPIFIWDSRASYTYSA